MTRFLFPVAIFLVFCLALAMRLPFLGNRPFHADEAVHAAKFAQLWQSGDYRYDPGEFHGPTIYFAALPIPLLQGRSNFAATRSEDYRLVTALFGQRSFSSCHY